VRPVELIPVITVEVLAASIFARLPGFSARRYGSSSVGLIWRNWSLWNWFRRNERSRA
jgi:hypothetical protein